MSLHLLVDGYNLMGRSGDLYGSGADDLEEAREKLIETLAKYRGAKGAKLTLVFDGGKGGYPTRRKERKRGLDIIFSKIGEEADHVIKDMIQEGKKSYVVVTSDNDIRDFAEARGLTTIRSGEFKDKMEMACYMADKGLMNEEEEDEGNASFSTKKKGNPRKRSKKERKRNVVLRKM